MFQQPPRPFSAVAARSACPKPSQRQSHRSRNRPARTHLDLCLLPTGTIIVPCSYALRDEFPQLPRLPLALCLDRRDRHFLLRARNIDEDFASFHIPALRTRHLRHRVPQAVRDRGRASGANERRLVLVRLAAKVSLALVLDGRRVPRGRDDVTRVGEFNVRAAEPEPVDAEAGKGDEVFLDGAVGELVREDGVPDLLDDDAPRGEGCLLCVVAREDESLRGVRDAVRGNGRVVGDLLDGQRRLPATVRVWPSAEEQLAEDGVEGFLF